MKLLFLFCLLSPDGIQALLVPLAQDPQCILFLDLRHLVPVADSRQRSIHINNHWAQVVQRNSRATFSAEIEALWLAGLCRFSGGEVQVLLGRLGLRLGLLRVLGG